MPSSKRTAVPRKDRSLRRQVAETLRWAIVHGDLQPGQRLLEEELAEQLQMSRGPIREALRELEQEGLVASFPYRGTVVAQTWDDEVLEVLVPIRATLEDFALRKALPHMTAADYDALEQLVTEMETTSSVDALPRLIELEMDFHRLLVERSEQFHSLQLWDMIAPRVRGFLYRMGPERSAPDTIASRHRELLNDLRSGDPERAQAALRDHVIGTPRLNT